MMGLLGSIKDHIMIGGPNAIAGWGLFVLLFLTGGIREGRLVVDPTLFIAILLAAVITGNGIYALNAYYDSVADKINKPNRPIPSGRMTREHAMKYAWALLALGMLISVMVSVVFKNYLMVVLWSLFTLLGIAYSTPPVKLKARHILGNLAFGAFCALPLFAMMFRVRPMDIIGVLTSAFFTTIWVAGLITMKDFYDTEGDRAAGDITLPVKVGKRRAAAISIVLMAIPVVYSILTWNSPIVYSILTLTQSPRRPELTLESFVQWNFWQLIYITSFGVYIALDYIWKHSILSDPYARVQYYFILLLAAYNLLKSPLGLPVDMVGFWERPIIFSLYVITASVAVYQSWKARRDMLKPA